jgi:hypothetical protein
MSTETSSDIHWSKHLEEFFKSTAEICDGYAWLHKHAEQHFSSRTVFFDLPTIILGSLNGAASIGSKSLFGDNEYAAVGIGAIALTVSMLNTINSYFSWSRRSEQHRLAAIQYAKLHRFLKVELTLKPTDRMRPKDLLKTTREQVDRLSEISPLIPASVVKDFKTKFADKYPMFSFPPETNGLQNIVIYNDTPDTPNHTSGPNTDV